MADQAERAARFLALHEREQPLLLANAWDAGSAKLFASIGYEAIATTSSGFAATLGRRDGGATREQVIAHAAALAAATELPVSADFEDCFADDAVGVAETVNAGREAGLAGLSIEDWSGGTSSLYVLDVATERVAAAAEAAHSGPVRLVLTARAENHFRGNPDTADTIARLKAYEEAGADVLFAPLLDRPEDLRELLAVVTRPVSVLVHAGTPSVRELADLGVRRVSVGGAFAFAAYDAALASARELQRDGTYAFAEHAAAGSKAARAAFSA